MCIAAGQRADGGDGLPNARARACQGLLIACLLVEPFNRLIRSSSSSTCRWFFLVDVRAFVAGI